MCKQYSKGEVIDLVWQYSRYYGNQLAYLSEIEENGNASLFYLFNILENIFKTALSDYDSNFQYIVKDAHKNGLINQKEHDFLNNKHTGVRRIRNLLAHANLAKFNLLFSNDESLHPIVENESCQQLYNILSDIIFNILLKVVSVNFSIDVQVDIDNLIKGLDFQIIEISAEDILLDKGINIEHVPNWDELPESDKYRIAENAQNVNVLTHIFKSLKP